jgi:hypothetical protein
VRRARVEPHVHGVGELAVLLRVDAEVLGARGEPRLDAALLDLVRDLVDQRFGVRVRLVRIAIEEEGQRRAPVALARERPVGSVLDHGDQARASPLGEEARVGDGVQRDGAQRACPSVPGLPMFTGLSMATNHCVVARKMIGVLWRQQCG